MKPRDVPNRNFANYWLAMSDAAAFNLAQTALALATRLRTDIAAHVQIAAALPASEIAVLMLTAADAAWGKAMSERLVKEIVGSEELDKPRLAKVYFLVCQAMKQLPESAWDARRLSARQDLLSELGKRGYGLLPALPRNSIKEEIMEKEWIRQLRETRASMAQGK